MWAVMGTVIDEAKGLRQAFWPSNLFIDLSGLLGTRRWGSTGPPGPGTQLNLSLSNQRWSSRGNLIRFMTLPRHVV